MLSGKLKGMGGFSGKESSSRTASSVDGQFPLVRIFCCGSLQPHNAAIGGILSVVAS
jgi:hypothetical protein